MANAQITISIREKTRAERVSAFYWDKDVLGEKPEGFDSDESTAKRAEAIDNIMSGKSPSEHQVSVLFERSKKEDIRMVLDCSDGQTGLVDGLKFAFQCIENKITHPE